MHRDAEEKEGEDGMYRLFDLLSHGVRLGLLCALVVVGWLIH